MLSSLIDVSVISTLVHNIVHNIARVSVHDTIPCSQDSCLKEHKLERISQRIRTRERW